MEYATGSTLHDYLKRNAPLSPRIANRVALGRAEEEEMIVHLTQTTVK